MGTYRFDDFDVKSGDSTWNSTLLPVLLLITFPTPPDIAPLSALFEDSKDSEEHITAFFRGRLLFTGLSCFREAKRLLLKMHHAQVLHLSRHQAKVLVC
jgi:hypothetical protein